MLKRALWIEPAVGASDSAMVFRKIFDAPDKIVNAVLAVTALGAYDVYLNGECVGDIVLAPGWTYAEKRLQYQTYDIKALLKAQNELLITVGSGWIRSRICAGSGIPVALIAAITLTAEDGNEYSIQTDESWSSCESCVRFSDIYDGEIYDATWNETSYAPVICGQHSHITLCPQENEPIREQERIHPRRLIVTPKGERVLDFGQNLTGYLQFSVNGKAGDILEFHCAEILDKDGNFYNANYRSAKAVLRYICREGRQTYKPRFTYFAFRYIRLEAFPFEVCLDDFCAVQIHSDMRRTGYLHSENSKLNQLFSNVVWGQKDNFLDVPVDCPQRDERLGWTGDAQVFAKTASYNFDVKRFFIKWLRDIRDNQYPDGLIPLVIPYGSHSCNTGYGDALGICAWRMYLVYGDVRVLKDNFDAMCAWIDFIGEHTLEDDLWYYDGPDMQFRGKPAPWGGKHVGDWLALDVENEGYLKGATDESFIASVFYAHSAELVVKAGQIIGRNVERYRQLKNRIINKIRIRFANRKTQTEHVLALQYGISENPKAEAAELVKMIRECGNHLTTGFFGTPYILHVLTEYGYSDIAYNLLLREEYPSWLYSVNLGATTMWEHWDGIRQDGSVWDASMNSYNHYWLGCVSDWVYEKAAGINPVEEAPGFRRILIAPNPDARLGALEACLVTEYGTIRSAWRYTDRAVRYEIDVPTEAVVMIDGKSYMVGKGRYVFSGLS